MPKQAKSERLMNLVICLLVSRGYVPKSKIRQVVGGYGDQSNEAFERMFERDKEELRELGIPIETGSNDPAGDEEPGYSIRRQEFELPEIRLEHDEAAVLGLAARVWQHASLAEATSAGNVMATSQLALPEDVCDLVYATDGYEQSVENKAQTSLDSDMVFSDGVDQQLAGVNGDVDSGYTATLALAV